MMRVWGLIYFYNIWIDLFYMLIKESETNVGERLWSVDWYIKLDKGIPKVIYSQPSVNPKQ